MRFFDLLLKQGNAGSPRNSLSHRTVKKAYTAMNSTIQLGTSMAHKRRDTPPPAKAQALPISNFAHQKA